MFIVLISYDFRTFNSSVAEHVNGNIFPLHSATCLDNGTEIVGLYSDEIDSVQTDSSPKSSSPAVELL